MPVPGYAEQIIVASVLALVPAWIKLLRHDGKPRQLIIFGLLAYFIPIIGPIAVLVLLGRDEREHDRPPRWIANQRYTFSRQAAG